MMMQDVALQLLVVAMMMAIGLELRAAELTEVFRRPGALVGALLLNVVAFPAWAWWMGGALGLSEGARVGLLLCAAAPGGPTSVMRALL